jgi:hypothetical protein
MTKMTDVPTDPRLHEIIAEYLAERDAGRQPDRAALLARVPDLAAELSAFFADDDRMRGREAPRPAPRRVGGYELLEEIGRGGMGVVHRARQDTLGREVALKMILAVQVATPADAERFRREALAAAKLDHPNIVPIYEVGEDGGRHFLSMKLFAGGSLAGRLPEWAGDAQRAARLVAAVARAVQHSHERGVLHRDLKPANVLLDEDGTPVVADFGLAKHLTEDPGVASSGAVVGTPLYMAPEQAAGGPLTPAADVWSLGVMLHELLTGKPPFVGANALETLRLAAEGEVAPLRRPDGRRVDRRLERVCRACLQQKPHLRYPTAAALADDLERWIAGERLRAPRPPLRRRAWRWAWRWRRALLVVTLLTVALLGAAATFAIYVPLANRAHERSGLAPVRRALGEGDVAEARRLYQEARPGFRHLWFDPEGRTARDRWDGLLAAHLRTIHGDRRLRPDVSTRVLLIPLVGANAWTADGRKLLVGGSVFDLETGDEVRLEGWQPPPGPAAPQWRSLSWEPGSTFLYQSTFRYGATWDATTGRKQGVPAGLGDALEKPFREPFREKRALAPLALSPDRRYLLVGWNGRLDEPLALSPRSVGEPCILIYDAEKAATVGMVVLGGPQYHDHPARWGYWGTCKVYWGPGSASFVYCAGNRGTLVEVPSGRTIRTFEVPSDWAGALPDPNNRDPFGRLYGTDCYPAVTSDGQHLRLWRRLPASAIPPEWRWRHSLELGAFSPTEVWVSALLDLTTGEISAPSALPLTSPEKTRAALAELPLAVLWQCEAPRGASAVLVSPDGRRALTVGNGFINLWALDGAPSGGPRP